MGFIEWCDFVLDKIMEMAAGDVQVRSYGTDEWDIARAIVGSDTVSQPGFDSTPIRRALLDALEDLASMSLLKKVSTSMYKLTADGERFAEDKIPVWEAICATTVKPEQQEVLLLVNRLSPHSGPDHAWLDWVNRNTLLAELNWSGRVELLPAIARELQEQHLVRTLERLGPHIDLKATYRGLVWELRRGLTLESKFIDSLVAEWETDSVEFKRQLETKTADQKAELIKDVIALANTQVSGQRWMIIGFDDESRSYYGPPDPKITQEHLEQLMSQYTAPVVDIR